jgi:hypothetical protein
VQPEFEVRIAESTSWSCAHGIERWRSDCGCHTGGPVGWNQRWRAPLREALDWLRDTLRPLFEEHAGALLHDPWAARNDYIHVVLDRRGNTQSFLDRHAIRPLTDDERVRVLELMEMQRHAMFMYTSCGWFFNDVAGIETVQILAYAGRVLQLAEKIFGGSYEPEFLELLAKAESNDPAVGTARDIYERDVVEARVDLMRVAAHYAVDNAFESTPPSRVYCYRIEILHHAKRTGGETQLIAARVRITSEVTQESGIFTYAVLHLGGHNVAGGLRPFTDDVTYAELVDQLVHYFEAADLSAVVRILAAQFPQYPFSLKVLFNDRQRDVLYRLLQSSVRKAGAAYRRVYQENTPLTRFLVAQDLPLPRAFMLAAEFVINNDLRAELEADDIDVEHTRALVEEAVSLKVQLDKVGLSFAVKRTLERLTHRLREHPADTSALDALANAAVLARSLPFSVDLWKVQNDYYELLLAEYKTQAAAAADGDEESIRWVELFTAIGSQLEVAVT